MILTYGPTKHFLIDRWEYCHRRFSDLDALFFQIEYSCVYFLFVCKVYMGVKYNKKESSFVLNEK